MEKKALRRNKVINHLEIKEKAIEKNRVAGYFEIKEEIKSANRDMSEISFFY